MEPKDVVVEGLEDVIQMDLDKHKAILERTQGELLSYKTARSHEIKKKRHYRDLVGQGKYDDEALESAMSDIAINIRAMSDKVDAAQEKLQHETLIVDTLTKQLTDQNTALEYLAKYRREHGNQC